MNINKQSFCFCNRSLGHLSIDLLGLNWAPKITVRVNSASEADWYSGLCLESKEWLSICDFGKNLLEIPKPMGKK